MLRDASDGSLLVPLAEGGWIRRMKDGIEHEFDAWGYLLETRDLNGNTTTYSYNPDGTLASIMDPAGFRTTSAIQAVRSCPSPTMPGARRF